MVSATAGERGHLYAMFEGSSPWREMDEHNLLAFFMRAQFRPLLAFKVRVDEGHETDQQIENHQERISKAQQQQIDSVKRTTKHEDEERNKRQHCSRNAYDIPLGRSPQRHPPYFIEYHDSI